MSRKRGGSHLDAAGEKEVEAECERLASFRLHGAGNLDVRGVR